MTKQPELSLDADQMDATVLTLLGEQNDTGHDNTEQSKPKKRGRKRKEPADTQTEADPKPAKRGRGRPSNASAAAASAAAASAARAAANSSPSSSSGSEVCNAARERSRVKTLRDAFLDLQRSLPSVPPDTKLSKLDVLVLATTYIAHLMKTLDGDADVPEFGSLLRSGREARGSGSKDGGDTGANLDHKHRLKADGYLHPVKKWPMRSRLYAGALLGCVPNGS
ncbi:transcription factor 24-like [Acanthaster planci]|uniref:Transcription factor 24-like n=1 Tax=Acanthaster planci TaxID=133434 RepID=A0A8B7YLR3_ACAPL|nr:transcription factor 24-like [Acanthaster planci]